MRTQNFRKYLEFAGLCLLAGLLLWWFGHDLNWSEVGGIVSRSNPYLLVAASGIVCFSYLVRAFRWGAFLKPLGPARLSDLFAATTIGFGTVFLIGRAGEIVRPVVLPMRDRRVRPSAAIVTIMVERIYDMMAVVLLFAVNLLWFKPTIQVSLTRIRILGVALVAATSVGILVFIWFRRNSRLVITFLSRVFDRLPFLPGRLTRFALSTFEQLARALRVLVNFGELAETIGWTALLWIGVTLANLLVVRAFGLHFGLTETVFVLGWSLAGSLVPTPGGAAGAFHAATAAAFILLGVGRERAAAISIVLHIIDFGPALLVGFFYTVRGDLNFSRLRELASSEAVEHVVEEEDLVVANSKDESKAFGKVISD